MSYIFAGPFILGFLLFFSYSDVSFVVSVLYGLLSILSPPQFIGLEKLQANVYHGPSFQEESAGNSLICVSFRSTQTHHGSACGGCFL